MNVDPSGARWFKSSHSGGSQECVEVTFLDAGPVGVRDSKNPTGPALIFAPSDWDAFTSGIATGNFDLH
ncbi:DUF397 domain-containing protein [Nocardia sp. SYP-A9097]|uniref:DUF397 domain-containing protein n=1 Tax=Nocardia sp. SYP-A9097 TaxID=2663237 RepID=UPI00129B01EF|nr:DUF397 domain-containing protein [Nocardia sp. SYP-A9097]MRH91530.1 DUF397 domain-containing protein [Nocardia sp. SYP-A9097]